MKYIIYKEHFNDGWQTLPILFASTFRHDRFWKFDMNAYGTRDLVSAGLLLRAYSGECVAVSGSTTLDIDRTPERDRDDLALILKEMAGEL
jgi:hypothetical protein